MRLIRLSGRAAMTVPDQPLVSPGQHLDPLHVWAVSGHRRCRAAPVASGQPAATHPGVAFRLEVELRSRYRDTHLGVLSLRKNRLLYG
jgi:hypothetical protein